MPIKKSELYSSIWQSCDELRGGMDASQYKDYVLVLLFMKYVSDKYAGEKKALIVVPKGGSFSDMVTLKGDKAIGEKINIIVSKLAEANDLRGVIDQTDFNDPEKLGKGKEMVDRLSNLVSIFNKPELDFKGNRAEGDDLLGDAYEYLMRHFATESGKSKGQFYTPAEVSRIIAKVIGVGDAKSASQTIYDPTCGSGSLLLKAHDEAKGRTGLDLTIYGQEMDNATSALAKMNMILHDCPTAEIWKDNTLASPHFKDKADKLKTFDFAVANPPFSTKAWSSGLDPLNDLYGRFELGIPPAKNGDYAFLLHVLTSLKTTGKGAVILPHGVLFRGNVEADIRKNVVRRGYIKGIIGLPANLFYGTGIPACIAVVDKENAAARKGIFMIDASKGFIKDGNKNRLRDQDIHKIVDAFSRQLEIPKYSRMVPIAEIETNDFNLNIPRYIDSTEAEDLQDIDAHLRGGIPERDIDDLAGYWEVFPSVRAALFKKGNRAGYVELKVPAGEIKSTIFDHPEFSAFQESVKKVFASWKKGHASRLREIKAGSHPKALIEELSESLLAAFEKTRLIDAYDVYQHLMSYWSETMQDDLYMIVGDGWKEAAKPRVIAEDKAKKEKADFVVGKVKYKAELIPPELVVARYFAAEKSALEALEAEVSSVEQRLEEMKEENSGEEGLLVDVIDEKGKVSKAAVADRLKEIQKQTAGDKDEVEERTLLEAYLALVEEASAANRKVKDADVDLQSKIAAKYGKLTVEEIQTLVIDDKWLGALDQAVHSEMDRVSQALTGRIKELADRYGSTLPKLVGEVEALSKRVDVHLKKMGFAWN